MTDVVSYFCCTVPLMRAAKVTRYARAVPHHYWTRLVLAGAGVERMFPHGSTVFCLSGIFCIADLYASSSAFCFSSSSDVIGRLSPGEMLIPGIGICADDVPIAKAVAAPARTSVRNRFHTELFSIQYIMPPIVGFF
jgi:hypothetical protein